MKITLFTSNSSRHNYFINLLSKVSKELFVIQECSTIFPGIMPGNYPISKIMVKITETIKKTTKSIRKYKKTIFTQNL